MKKYLIFLIFFFAAPCFAQGLRVGDDRPVTGVQTAGGPIFSISNATISFCANPANAVPCTNKVTTYTDITLGTPCPTSTQVTLVGSTSCVGTSDQYGNWGVWVPAGTYSYTIQLPGGGSIGPYVVTLSASSGGGGTLTNISFAGSPCLPPLYTCSIANPTSTPSLSYAQINANANTIFAGPASGSPAPPTLRAMVAADVVLTGTQPNNGAVILARTCNGQANCYQTPANTQYVVDAVFTASSPNVATATTDPPFVVGDVGKRAQATQNCQGISDLTNPEICYPGCPDTTIKTFTDAHHVVLNANCTANSTNPGLTFNRFAWGTPDDTAIASARTALMALGHGTLDLPCTGLWVEQAPFVFPNGDATVNGPLAVRGCPGGTIMIPGFNFDYTTCGVVACIYDNPYLPDNSPAIFSDVLLRDLNVQGLGIDGASVPSGHAAINVDAQQSFDNVVIAGWNWNAPSGFSGFVMNQGFVRGGGVQAGGTWGITVGTGGTIIGMPFINGGAKSGVRVSANYLTIIGSTIYKDAGTNCGTPDTQAVYVTAGALTLINDAATEVCQTGGTVLLDSFTAFGGTGLYVSTGGTVYAHNAAAAGTVYGQWDLTNTTFYDQGGNSAFQWFDDSGAGNTIIGSASITGVADVAGNHVLTSGWGTANVNTVSGFTTAVTFKVSVTGGSPGSGPVLTDSFPTPASSHLSKFFAPPLYCTLTQIAGNTGDISLPVASSLTASGVAWTFTGTPVSGHSYTFVRNCYQ